MAEFRQLAENLAPWLILKLRKPSIQNSRKLSAPELPSTVNSRKFSLAKLKCYTAAVTETGCDTGYFGKSRVAACHGFGITFEAVINSTMS